MGALSVTSDDHYRAPFAPMVPGVRFVAVNDPAALLAAVSKSTAAIIAEPVQGEGGVRPLTPAFAAAITEACAKTGALLIADEVQSGLGRTGQPFYFSTLGLKPHLVSVGKALGGGVPVGAAIISDEVASTISYGDHGSTYGGNLLACRAAICFLDELTTGGVLENVRRVGRFFEERLRAIAAKHSFVKEVRGTGLIWGLELTRDASAVVPAGLAQGVVVNRTAETVVRLLPPLVITEAEADLALGRLDAALLAFGAGA
jgi:acetylornithine/N-succinyldiaminopimelate aminotransferase